MKDFGDCTRSFAPFVAAIIIVGVVSDLLTIAVPLEAEREQRTDPRIEQKGGE